MKDLFELLIFITILFSPFYLLYNFITAHPFWSLAIATILIYAYIQYRKRKKANTLVESDSEEDDVVNITIG